MTCQQASRKRHTGESTTGTKVSNLPAVWQESLNVRGSDEGIKKMSRRALLGIADPRQVNCDVPCIKQAKVGRE